MNSAEGLLNHIRCKQLLLCAYQPDAAEVESQLTLTDITSLLRINSSDCVSLVRRLQAKGLVEPRADGEPGSIRLTRKGERLVRRMVGAPAIAAGRP